MEIDENKVVLFDYMNWKGNMSTRKVMPKYVHFGSTEWHKEEQWLLSAWDIDKNDARDFAIKDISKWRSYAD